jgi:hypothetical protein
MITTRVCGERRMSAVAARVPLAPPPTMTTVELRIVTKGDGLLAAESVRFR